MCILHYSYTKQQWRIQVKIRTFLIFNILPIRICYHTWYFTLSAQFLEINNQTNWFPMSRNVGNYNYHTKIQRTITLQTLTVGIDKTDCNETNLYVFSINLYFLLFFCILPFRGPFIKYVTHAYNVILGNRNYPILNLNHF